MAMTRAQWNIFQQQLPQEDRMSYEEYIASETPASTSTATDTTTTTTATPTPSPTQTLSAAEIARLKAIEDAANVDRENTIATAQAADLAASGSSVNTDIKKGKLMGPSTDSKDGNTLEFKPITDGVRMAVFGLNPATGKPYTDAESAAVSGGYLPEGYKNLVGYRFNPNTGQLEVLNAAGMTSGLGARYQMSSKGNLIARPEFLPKGVGQDEDGKYYQPGEVMPNESLAQYAKRMSSIGGSGNFVYKGKNYLFDQKGEYYIPGEQDMPFGFGTPNNTPGMLSDGTTANTTKALVTGTSTNTSGINLPTGVTVTTTYIDPKTGDTVGVLSNGTTRVLTPGNTIATERANTIAVLQDRFKRYGLESLATKIQQLAIDGATESTITLSLQETDEYKTRFAANADRLKKGLTVLSPAEYLNAEDEYRQKLRDYGLKQFDTDAYVRQFISNDTSLTEISNRIVTAVQRVQNADPAVMKQLRDYYGITQESLVAYVLDPEQQFEKIKLQVASAEIGVEAGKQGLSSDMAVSEQLAKQGITQAEAQKGYATIADILPSAEKLSAIYGGRLDSYGQSEGEQEVFNSLASAQRKRQKLSAAEIAQFSGSSGLSKTSLLDQTKGQF